MINKGQTISFTTNAYPNKIINAKISFIDPLLNVSTRTVEVRAVLQNKNGLFKPGMFIKGEVEIAKSQGEDTIFIPESAVLWTGARSVVYIKTHSDEPVFEMREVGLGSSIGNSFQVLSGLEHGDQIVTNGAFTVDAAAQLQGKRSMMNKTGEKMTTGHEGHDMESDPNKTISKDAMNETDTHTTVDREFQLQFKAVYTSYIALKNALVESDVQTARTYAEHITKSLAQVDMELLKDSKHLEVWKDFKNKVQLHSQQLMASSNLDEQRDLFIPISNNFILGVKTFGVNEKVYSMYCPMANDNKGAYWLSSEENVVNPYFGSAMLTCGEVKETISK